MTKEKILAMEAGESLDAHVLHYILGIDSWGLWVKENGSPSTDISAAWMVIDKMFELGYAMSLLHLSSEFYPEYWYCDFRPKDSNKPPEYEWIDHQMTAPVAISKAALLARIQQ